ncbi:MAG: ribosome silencing factor [Clostridia bacterium]|nr:ribosome silencing factor [Clostridia bacterium]
MSQNQDTKFTEREIAEKIICSLAKHLGQEIKWVYAAEKTVLTDYYVLCVGRSASHMQSLASYLEEDLAKEGVFAFKTEGKNSAEWILVDFGVVIVHIFSKEANAFYHIDKLFGADAFLPVDDLVNPENDSNSD